MREGIECGGAAMQQLDTSAMLPDLVQPCLILSADLDRVVAADKAANLRALLPGASGVHLKNAGHAPYCEDVDGFNQAVDRFI